MTAVSIVKMFGKVSSEVKPKRTSLASDIDPTDIKCLYNICLGTFILTW